MNAETLAEWYRQRGEQVIRSASSYWAQAGPRVFQAIPYDRLISPDQGEITELIQKNNLLAVRFSAPFNERPGRLSYHVVYLDREYSMQRLRRKTRRHIEVGLEQFSVEQVPFERMADEGWTLRMDTLNRQNRSRAERQDWWRKLCKTAQILPGFEAWAAIKAGRLAATLIAFTCDDCILHLYQQSLTQALPERPNHALIYCFTQEMMRRKNLTRIYYGMQSLDAPESVDMFKFYMGYKAGSVRQRVSLHPGLARLVQSGADRLTHALAMKFPGVSGVQKADGLFRFYREGRLSDDDQPFPPAASKYRLDDYLVAAPQNAFYADE